MRKTLECSSKGDRRFSSLYAQVEVFGKKDTIENHYQLSKRFGKIIPKTWRDAKGRKPTHIVVNNVNLPVRYLTQWYSYLWLQYLDKHPELVEYASQFDEFTDFFSRPGANNQAEVIKIYVKEGREALLNRCKDIIKKLNLKEDKNV